MNRVLLAAGLVIRLGVGNVVGSLGWAPMRVTGQIPSMDERIGQLEVRVTTLEQDVQDLSARPVPATTAAAPIQIACRDLSAESRTSSYSNGGSLTIKTTTNLNGVDGLMQIEYTDGYNTTVNYSVPAWLLEAYVGNYNALMHEIRDGQLVNRRSAESCRR